MSVNETRVGRYRLEEVIGVGSFATVHRAVDERLDDTIVVKILAENHSLNPEVRERFIAEGRALRRIASPHVVTVHDIGESERQQPYLVLDLADRGTLAQRVAELRDQGWTAGPEDVLDVSRQLARALEAMHTAQLVHRDLSPPNVLLTTTPDAEAVHGSVIRADERLLLADLGMCKDLALNSGLTVAGGTAGFRPPEMDAGPAVIDTRADLWSLSALIRWLAEGGDLPAAFWTVVDRGQSAAPDQRHPDVTAWLAEVEAALAPAPRESPSEASPPEASGTGTSAAGARERHTESAPDGAQARRPTRRQLAILVAAIAALLLGLGGGWLLHGLRSTPTASSASARLAIQGPQQVGVGATATFTLVHQGVDSWVWILPTGRHIADTASVSLKPSGAGSSRVTVRAVDDEGRQLQASHEFTVTGS
ncbi:MAG: serine/threonine-protein kinase [Tetrasphaera sp.]